ncbi:polymorphic toxin-type HINT domain-containing protein, partial [Segatella oris]|uniref:polymorphic toxin-type HINT domain-containing protein n=1 Tax=Segatella oris TaxID=28135 RepID=UPI00241DF26B
PCSLGGKINFVTSGQIPLPDDAMEDIKALQEQGAKEDEDEGWGWLDTVELIPVVGSIVGAVREGMKGNWGMMAMNIGFLALDVAGLVSFGATTAASSAGKAGIKAGVKVAAKSATKIATKQAGKSGLKTAIKLTAKGAKKAFCESIDKIVGKASAGHVCVFACFPAGTKINTAVGLKNIEDIKVGDKVWSYNELTGETGLQEIVRTMVRESDHTIELYTEEEIIETTAEHPFLTENGWKDAAELQTGDRIKSRNEEDVEIKDVKFSYKPRKVYNFEVSNWHTYFVGALQWLVHNAKKCLSKLPQQIHHFATNKSKKYTKQFEKIAKKFKLDLNGSWNKEALPHRGRHPYNYHEWVLKEMKDASKAAGKSQKKFLKLFEENVKKEVRENPDLLRKAGWE